MINILIALSRNISNPYIRIVYEKLSQYFKVDWFLPNFSSSNDELNKYDVIPSRKNWLYASFAIFINIEIVKILFKLSGNWQNVFQIQYPCRFTEFGSGDVRIIKELEKGSSINILDKKSLTLNLRVYRIL